MNNSVIIRTRGGHKEGMGDITSSIAIASALRNMDCNVLFCVNDCPSVTELLDYNGFTYIVADTIDSVVDNIRRHSFSAAVLNQLNSPLEEARFFRKTVSVLFTLDDIGPAASLATHRINVLYATEDAYTDFAYIGLSVSFKNKHKKTKKIKRSVKSILVTQGGSDTHGFTPLIARALYSMPSDIKISLVLGPNFSHYEEMHDAIRNAPRQFDLIESLNDLSDAISEADLAVCAGGNTLFEMACLGTPAIVICGERFEIETAMRMQASGFSEVLGFGDDIDEDIIRSRANSLILDYTRRKSMSKKGKELVDGKGAERIAELILYECSRITNKEGKRVASG